MSKGWKKKLIKGKMQMANTYIKGSSVSLVGGEKQVKTKIPFWNNQTGKMFKYCLYSVVASVCVYVWKHFVHCRWLCDWLQQF